MNPETPLGEECGRPGRTQNRTEQIFCTDHTLVSLPDKDALLLLLRLKRMHGERHKLPERHMKYAHRLALNEWSDHYEKS